MSEHHDYHIAAEADVTGKVNRHIWYYFIGLAVVLFITIGGLNILYLFQVDYEMDRKIGDVKTRESLDQVATSEGYLSGKLGLFDQKRHVAIDDAMNRFLSDLRKTR